MPVKVIIGKVFVLGWLFSFLLAASTAQGQQRQTSASADWDAVVDAAKKEGKVTVSLPASAEMKKQIEEQFKKRYGIEVETFTSRGSTAGRRMADEFKAGVRSFDLHIGGFPCCAPGMMGEGVFDSIGPWPGLPEAKHTKQMWGGEYVGRKHQPLFLTF